MKKLQLLGLMLFVSMAGVFSLKSNESVTATPPVANVEAPSRTKDVLGSAQAEGRDLLAKAKYYWNKFVSMFKMGEKRVAVEQPTVTEPAVSEQPAVVVEEKTDQTGVLSTEPVKVEEKSLVERVEEALPESVVNEAKELKEKLNNAISELTTKSEELPVAPATVAPEVPAEK